MHLFLFLTVAYLLVTDTQTYIESPAQLSSQNIDEVLREQSGGGDNFDASDGTLREYMLELNNKINSSTDKSLLRKTIDDLNQLLGFLDNYGPNSFCSLQYYKSLKAILVATNNAEILREDKPGLQNQNVANLLLKKASELASQCIDKFVWQYNSQLLMGDFLLWKEKLERLDNVLKQLNHSYEPKDVVRNKVEILSIIDKVVVGTVKDKSKRNQLLLDSYVNTCRDYLEQMSHFLEPLAHYIRVIPIIEEKNIVDAVREFEWCKAFDKAGMLVVPT